MFILAAERDATGVGFERYRSFLATNADRFPPSALQLARSDWYYDPRDHRCPHDAWLESAALEEPASGARGEERYVTLRVRLFGAYHDGYIELCYPRVFGYQLDLTGGELGHRDFRYDEFRLTDRGHLVHEIEWAGNLDTARWIIEATDVEFTWSPAGTEQHPHQRARS